MATNSVDSLGALCGACSKIPWDTLGQSPTSSFMRVRDLPETKTALQSSSCRICRLISTIQPTGLEGQECFLLARRSEHIFASTGSQGRFEYRESMMLEVAESDMVYGRHGGYLNVYNSKEVPDLGVRCVAPRSIDWDFIKASLAYCRKRHRKRCKQTGPDGPIPQLRVIDCTHASLTVIPAPDQCEYVALSYVWGSPPASGIAGSQAPCSQTVKDAIKATLALGMRYLWVDQHCIIQSDPADKKLQIAQMGRIYASSEITIIAAAGHDASYGLPGVDKIHRRKQHVENVGTVSVIKRPPWGPEVIKTSKWASRAWTYQEAYLSRRRLFFTDHETSFLCNNFYRAESDIMEKQQLWAPLTTNRYELHYFGGIVPTQLGNDAARSFENMASLMYEYSKRQLSYQSDAHDACLGVLNYLKDMDVTSVWGIPLAEIDDQICFPINWHHSQSSSRRRCFPTWSFLEWEGSLGSPVRWRSSTLYNVSLGTSKEARHPLDSSFISSLAGSGSPTSDLRFLHLHGLVINLSIQHMKWEGEVVQKKRKLTINGSTKTLPSLSEGRYVTLEVSKDARMLLGVDVDRRIKLPTSTIGVLLDENDDQLAAGEQRAEMLVLADRGEYFERLSIAKYSFSSGEEESEGSIVFTTSGGQVLEDFRWQVKRPLWREQAKYATIIIG